MRDDLGTGRAVTRRELIDLERRRKTWPERLEEVPESEWRHFHPSPMPIRVLRSKHFLVQVYAEAEGMTRLSVSRTIPGHNGWGDKITWDELQQVKTEACYGERDAVEVYPPDFDVVNVANMRHLWVYPEGSIIPFAWRRK